MGLPRFTGRKLKLHKGKVLTITQDSGKEFANHEKLSEELEVDVYFAHPYSSWERGLSENTNRFFRQYFPKDRELLNVKPEELEHAVNRLNHRPRKSLDYRRPHKAYYSTTESVTVVLTELSASTLKILSQEVIKLDNQPTELREFVYLDEISLNNHLSTLGGGIPKEIVQESGSEMEKSGSGRGNFTLPLTNVGIKGGGKISHSSKENVLTRMQITAPYRFEEFLKSLSESGFDILGNEELDKAKRGRVVKVEGKIWPMSLFKVETAIKLFLEMLEEETLEHLEKLPNENESNSQEVISNEGYQQFKAMNQLIEKFIGEKIPIRMHRNGHDVGVALDRNYMRTNPFRTFAEQKEFTLVGRVEERLSPSDTWDPNDLTTLTREYLSQDQANEILKTLEEDLESGEQFNMSFEEKDKLIQGLGLVVSPIAIYW